ncbi:hypothetical protein UPYG_G00046050 [Umbra pygmaea]|uniref:Uncharacterized protein n=1 Tax=Umbra pygmaea TaxID=75934 RepID=A0ABD0XR20_UMBPY
MVVWAILKADFIRARTLIEAGARVNGRDEEQRTPLMLCCLHDGECRSLGVAQMLLVYKGSVGLCDRRGRSALMYAVLYERLGLVRLFLQALDYDLNHVDECGHTALGYAAQVENRVIYDLLLRTMKKYGMNSDVSESSSLGLCHNNGCKILVKHRRAVKQKGFISAAEVTSQSNLQLGKALSRFLRKELPYMPIPAHLWIKREHLYKTMKPPDIKPETKVLACGSKKHKEEKNASSPSKDWKDDLKYLSKALLSQMSISYRPQAKPRPNPPIRRKRTSRLRTSISMEGLRGRRRMSLDAISDGLQKQKTAMGLFRRRCTLSDIPMTRPRVGGARVGGARVGGASHRSSSTRFSLLTTDAKELIMSTRRRSHLLGENMATTRPGERTPLRNVQNEMSCLTPSSRMKPRSMSGSNVLKTLKNDNAFIYPDKLPHYTQPAEVMCTFGTPKPNDKTPTIEVAAVNTGSAIGDITLKSFICAGGEVEVSDPTRVLDETILLPTDQQNISYFPDNNNGNSCLSDSMITHSCANHIDHPYCDLEYDFAGTATDSSFNGVSNTSLGSLPPPAVEAHMSGESTGVQTASSQQGDVTFMSSTCIGGEVKMSGESIVEHEHILLPDVLSANHLMNEHQNSPSILVDNLYVQSSGDHVDHSYFDNASDMASTNADFQSNWSLQSGVLNTRQVINPNDEPSGLQTSFCEQDVTFKSFICTGLEVEIPNSTTVSEDTLDLTRNQSVTNCISYDDTVNPSVIEDHCSGHEEHPYCHEEREGAVVEPSPGKPFTQSLKNPDVVICQLFPEDPNPASCLQMDVCVTAPSFQLESDVAKCNDSSARGSTMMDKGHPVVNSDLCSSGSVQEESGRDSALGSSSNAHISSIPIDQAGGGNQSEVLTELLVFPSLARGTEVGDYLDYELFSPILRATPVNRRVFHKSALPQTEDSALDMDRERVPLIPVVDTCVAPANSDCRVWAGGLESPMPLPKFNSTTLCAASDCKPPLSKAPVRENVEVEPEVDVAAAKVMSDVEAQSIFDQLPGLVPDGLLQQHLHQIVHLLMLASGRIGAPRYSAPDSAPSAERITAGALDVVCHSACVGTTPVRRADHSSNTSGLFERKRALSLSDASTSTDSLLWNLAPGSLSSVSKPELEQRLASTLIMVEALLQQLSSARGQDNTRGPGPSELRDKLVQTDHTELSQTVTYRDLYMTALERIDELQLDRTALQNLFQGVQETRTALGALSGDTAEALCCMRQVGDLVRADQHRLAAQYVQMRSLYAKCKETQDRMAQKVRDALQQREDMRRDREEAFSSRQAAFSATELLRSDCALRIRELEESVGSMQELMEALTRTYPEQVNLNKSYVDSLNSASVVLSETLCHHAALQEKLKTAGQLLKKSCPLLVRLNEKAASALAERDQAVAEREQTQEELAHANSCLQDARQEIGDLNLQTTIMSSEVGVLRQKLSEGEEERLLLERKVTEMSATVSSSLASYAFLEQALTLEGTKLQQSWNEVKQITDKANRLEGALGQSEQRVSELTQSLVKAEEQLARLQNLSHSQSLQLQELQDVQSRLQSMKEINEFLQMENDMAREQVLESEATLRVNLQGLRERNIQCEDLRAALSQLQAEKEALQVELDDSRARTRSVEVDLGEQLAQAVTEVTLIHHTLRILTNEVQSTLASKEQETSGEDKAPALYIARHPSTSFVDSVMVAIASEQAPSVDMQPPSEVTQEQAAQTMGSENSAFTRLTRITPKKYQCGAPDEEQSSVVSLLADLTNTVSELSTAVTQLRQRRGAEQQALDNIVCDLKGELQSQAARHSAQVCDLTAQLGQLQTQLEQDRLSLHNKAQEMDMMKKICSEVTEAREFLHKHKSENIELRREVAVLRRSLHESQVESQALREELKNSGSQSAHSMHSMDNKIHLLKEMDRLKRSLLEAEEGRAKLLDRAKRHQIIHETNHRKQERELRVLDDIIETVRKTLSSIPDVVRNCKELENLVEFLG